ncbi:MAG: hypothetical protein IT383_02560 [Deltaproteobacteria bacterium]|nr:hypothetical protein [Deltaproteobacteria bacterium]
MTTTRRDSRILCRALGGGALLLASACFIDLDVGSRVDARALDVPTRDSPIDILFVVDNSGSMAEEQAALARTLMRAECPIEDLLDVPEGLIDPGPDMLEELSELCGLAQILASYQRDFRIGVITTDVNACDNAVGWELDRAQQYRPQRGCLQPVPVTGQKVLTPDTPELASAFLSLVTDLGTSGSPVERGLDAAQIFLERDTWVSPGCEGDRELFLRDDAELLLIFVTDEDDCSNDGSTEPFTHYTSAVCDQDLDLYLETRPNLCYERADELTPVARYAERLRALKGEGRDAWVRVGVIGGVVGEGERQRANGCVDVGGVVENECIETGGLSNFTSGGYGCDPEVLDGELCCTADGARRYFRLRSELAPGRFEAATICQEGFISSLIDMALPPS